MRRLRAHVPGDFQAVVRWDRRALAWNCFQASLVLLVASVLYQRPLVAIRSDHSSVLLRPWDFAWLLFVLASAGALATLRPPVNLRLDVRKALGSPLALLLAYGALGVISLTWHYVAFRGDGLRDAVIGAARILGAGYLATVLVLLWTERLARILRATVVASALIAAALALHGYLFAASDNGLGVTRAGGPFGNFFADATVDRWWAQTAASTELGFWLAAAVIVLCLWGLDPVHRNHAARLRAASGAGTLLVLVAALAVTHSRESWVALCGGTLIVSWALRDRLSLRGLGRGAAAALVVVVALVVLIPSVGSRLSESFQTDTHAYRTGPEARLEAWKDSVRIGNLRFPIGWGVSGVSAHVDRFGRGTAENMFLQAYMETGILGLALLVGLVATGARIGLRRLRTAPSDADAGLAAGLLALLAIHGLFGNSLGDPSVQILVGVAVASAIAADATAYDPPGDEPP